MTASLCKSIWGHALILKKRAQKPPKLELLARSQLPLTWKKKRVRNSYPPSSGSSVRWPSAAQHRRSMHASDDVRSVFGAGTGSCTDGGGHPPRYAGARAVRSGRREPRRRLSLPVPSFRPAGAADDPRRLRHPHGIRLRAPIPGRPPDRAPRISGAGAGSGGLR